jgi:diadenosine tetraphosphatase ApaH/serine/threonine PP2A family protein phosphatase
MPSEKLIWIEAIQRLWSFILSKSMANEEHKDLILRILGSRSQGEDHLHRGALAGCSIKGLIESAQTVLSSEAALLSLTGRYVVVGDLHGNIDDLLRIFMRFGYPPYRSYLFLGDYVDRGKNSIETILFLLALKVLYPTDIYLLRGNHECEAQTRKGGFKAECNSFFKNGITYHRFCEAFAHLPIAAVVNDQVFCVHGGLSPSLFVLEDLGSLVTKPLEELRGTVAEDILWSDPCPEIQGSAPSSRGVGCLFGSELLEGFLDENGLSCMIRAHQYCAQGCEMKIDNCYTVFSACDYGGKGNDGAVALVELDGSVGIERFRNSESVCHRFLIPPWICEGLQPKAPSLFEPADLTEIVIEIE